MNQKRNFLSTDSHSSISLSDVPQKYQRKKYAESAEEMQRLVSGQIDEMKELEELNKPLKRKAQHWLSAPFPSAQMGGGSR
jgi:hypothetical protein